MVVVGSDAAIARFSAAKALMNDDLFTIPPKPGADGRHQAAAIAQSVAGRLPVDMPREEAERTVISVTPTADRRSDKRLAVSTLELFFANTLGCWPKSFTMAMLAAAVAA